MIHFPRSLRARLLLANLVVAGVTLGTVLVAVSLVGPGYFAAAMGHNPNDPIGSQMDAATLDAFREAIRTALLAALLVALAVGLVVAILVSDRIAGPVARLAAAARRIAGGNYTERVPASGVGEIGDLAGAFNVMTASLEETERRRLQLVGDVAHELRTPLTTLDGYLEGLEDGVIDPSQQTWHVLRGQTARLTRLVSDLQELWRAEAGQLPLRVEVLDARTVVGEVVGQFEASAAARGIVLDAALPLVAMPVRADPVRLAQALANYMSNALRYAPDGSAVHVTVARQAAEVLMSVRDEGPGLTPEQAAHVFERFYRVDASRSRAEGGSGIGFAIVHALVEAMEGRVWVRSDGPGQGATFGVALAAA
ncbi:MAG: ATP-binding protein [Chloroflexota bacterium]